MSFSLEKELKSEKFINFPVGILPFPFKDAKVNVN